LQQIYSGNGIPHCIKIARVLLKVCLTLTDGILTVMGSVKGQDHR